MKSGKPGLTTRNKPAAQSGFACTEWLDDDFMETKLPTREAVKQTVREAVIVIARELCRLADDQQRRAESIALTCVLADEENEKSAKRGKVMELMGSSTAFRQAMKQCDELRVRIEQGEVV